MYIQPSCVARFYVTFMKLYTSPRLVFSCVVCVKCTLCSLAESQLCVASFPGHSQILCHSCEENLQPGNEAKLCDVLALSCRDEFVLLSLILNPYTNPHHYQLLISFPLPSLSLPPPFLLSLFPSPFFFFPPLSSPSFSFPSSSSSPFLRFFRPSFIFPLIPFLFLLFLSPFLPPPFSPSSFFPPPPSPPPSSYSFLFTLSYP